MADAKSNYSETIVLDWLLGGSNPTRPSSRYLALFTSDPTESGSGTELSGGSYVRKAVTFLPAILGSTTNSNQIIFTNLPAASVTHFGVYDAVSGGNLLYKGAWDSSQNISNGGALTILIAGITVGEL